MPGDLGSWHLGSGGHGSGSPFGLLILYRYADAYG